MSRFQHGRHDDAASLIHESRVVKRERQSTYLAKQVRNLLYRFRNHFHPYVPKMLSTLVTEDLDGFLSLDTKQPELREEFFAANYGPVVAGLETASEAQSSSAGVVNPLPVKELSFLSDDVYSVYNWELFFHVPFLIAVQLSKNQRYSEAQHWFHYIFDPTDNSAGPTPQRFWRVKPFQVDEVQRIEEILLNLSTGDDPALRADTASAIGVWRDNPFRPHAIARTRITAYMYKTVMAYLDNLIAWGDSLFQQDTRESINEALQVYVLAANVLGPRPQQVPRAETIKQQTYASLAADLDEFGNAARDAEAEIPFDLFPPATTGVGDSPESVALLSLGRVLYFCVPRNDKLIGYWDTVADRLYKIRNSLNLQGTFRQLPLFEPPIDPAMVARAVAAGVDVAAIVAGTADSLAPVRFQVLLQKAMEVCQEVKSLGGQILAALEKKDNEALGVLRAKYETNLLALAESVRFAQWKEAEQNTEGVKTSLQNAFNRYKYYDELLGESNYTKLATAGVGYDPLDTSTLDTPPGETPSLKANADADVVASEPRVELGSSFRDGGHKISPAEGHELDLMEAAQTVQDAAAVIDGVGAVLNMIPDFQASMEPFGIGAAPTLGGTNLGRLFQGLAQVARGVGARVQHEANLTGKMASYDRREQEWTLQRQSAAGEITQLYKQYRAAELRTFIAKREYDNHLKQIAQARDVEDFLTNEKRKKTNEDFYLWMKGEAQGLHSRCFQLAYNVAKKAERAFRHELGDATASFIQTGYLSGREGLFAGEKLALDLKRLELAYLENNKREYELTKHVSLRDWYPLALEELRRQGHCSFTLNEQLFDLDCPGHCFRRVKSVAVSIPSVVGPYTSVNCKIQLSDTSVRRPTGELVEYPVAVDTTVTSSAQSDTGLFEPNLRDERYLPFEGAGVIGTWGLTLLGVERAFDFDTIADVVLTIRYTARDGGTSTGVSTWLEQNAKRMFSMRHEFPTEWARYKSAPSTPLKFELRGEHFPFQSETAFSNVNQVHVVARAIGPAEAKLIRKNEDGSVISWGPIDLNGAPVSLPVDDDRIRSFNGVGSFELSLTGEINDLWLVFDCEPLPASDAGAGAP